eukprot:g1650.t1
MTKQQQGFEEERKDFENAKERWDTERTKLLQSLTKLSSTNETLESMNQSLLKEKESIEVSSTNADAELESRITELETERNKFHDLLQKRSSELEVLKTRAIETATSTDQKLSAKDNEIALLTEELTRTKSQVDTLEHRIDSLQKEKEQILSTKTKLEIENANGVNNAAAQQQKSQTIVQEELSECKYQLEETIKKNQIIDTEMKDLRLQNKTFMDTLRKKEEEILKKETLAKQLRTKLEKKPTQNDLDVIIQELHAVQKAHGMGSVDDFEEGGEDSSETESLEPKSSGDKDLSSTKRVANERFRNRRLLVAQCERWQSQVTTHRIRNKELTEESEDLRNELTKLQKILDETIKAKETLENQQNLHSVVDNEQTDEEKKGDQQNINKEPHSSSIGATGTTSTSSSSAPTTSSMVAMLKAQCERYREQIKIFETEKSTNLMKHREILHQKELFESEKIRLLEKIRYLESTTGRKENFSATGEIGMNHRGRTSGGDGGSRGSESQQLDDLESATSRLFESSLDPFTKFKSKERQKRYAQLALSEKIVYNCTKFLTSTKRTRNFLIGYVLILHFVILFIVVRFTMADYKGIGGMRRGGGLTTGTIGNGVAGIGTSGQGSPPTIAPVL